MPTYGVKPTWGPQLNRAHPSAHGIKVALFATEGSNQIGSAISLRDLANIPASSTITTNGVGLISWSTLPPDAPRLLFGGAGYIDPHRSTTGILSSTGNWTILFRARPVAVLDTGAWFSQYIATVNNGRLKIEVDGAPPKWRLFLGSEAVLGSVGVAGSTTVVAGTEYVVAASRNYRTFRLYVDGVQEASTTEAGTRAILQTGNLIGASNTTAGAYNAAPFDFVQNGSRLSYLLVWDRELSPGEIQRLSVNPYQLLDVEPFSIGALSPAATAPTAPTLLTADTFSSSRIDLAWTDNASDETGFKIERGTDGVNFAQIDTAAADAESYSDSACDPNTLYYYRVRAYNGAGDSAYTNIASAKTATDSEFQYLPIVLRTTGQQAQSDGRYLVLVDGVPEPDTVAGWAFMYIDEDDGDLKVKFGDGTIAVVAIDT